MNTNKTQQTKIQSILNLMDKSTMEEDEKQTWLRLLPLMNNSELNALHRSLENEVNALTDVFLDILGQRAI